MSITDVRDAALLLQSIEATDWSYCGEGARATRLKLRLIDYLRAHIDEARAAGLVADPRMEAET